MKAVLTVLSMIAITLLAVGCSSASKIGVVGDTTYYNVHAANLDGPNVTSVVAVTNGKARVVTSVGGPGILTVVAPAAVAATGEVAAANTFGANLKPDRTNVSAAGGSSSADQSRHDVHDSHNSSVDNSSHSVNQSSTVNVGK